MSRPLSRQDVLFRQRFLSCCGFYTDRLDGLWGDRTDEADHAFFVRSAAIAAAEGALDARSEGNILSLQGDAQIAARRSLRAIRDAGFDARIISGTRSYGEQAALFREGRFGNSGDIVTNADAGRSWHNFGLAWDIGLFEGRRYVEEDEPYNAASSHGKVAGVDWGGDWAGGFQDNPHYQLVPPGMSVDEARIRFEAGGRA
jgi:peptidoglycan L-alanyl-D-glutamate endopeptidase CwlK